MKKLTFLVVFAIPVLLIAQPCLPDGYTFNTQGEVDNFQTDFPNCTEIGGDVTIRSAEISNLNGLSVITSIGGSLTIRENHMMTNFNGLDNLTAIGGYLWIADHNTLTSLSGLENLISVNGFCNISNNATLTNLNGLNNLTRIGSLNISNNPTLSSFTGLGNLVTIDGGVSVTDNAILPDLTGLNKLDSIGGTIYIANNDKMTSLTGLNKVTTIGGDIDIPLNNALINFSGLDNLTLVGGHIWISDNAALTSLSGFDNITSIGGYLMLKYNINLTSLKSIGNIDAASIDSLLIIDNYSLSSCEAKSVCNYIASPDGNIVISNNATGCNSKEEVDEACKAFYIAEQTSIQKLNTFPNPCSTTMTIEYELNHPETVRITFYNQFGKQVDRIEQKQAAGVQHVVWTPELPGGVYYFRIATGRLEAGEKVASGKLMKTN